MSDERDIANAAADDADTAGSSPSAPATGPLRPTGKRSRQRSGDTALADREDVEEALTEKFEVVDVKSAKKAKNAGKPNRNPFVAILTYIKQVVAELRKVIWPSRKQMASYTAVVLVFLVFMVTLIGLVDLGLAKLVLWVFG